MSNGQAVQRQDRGIAKADFVEEKFWLAEDLIVVGIHANLNGKLE